MFSLLRRDNGVRNIFHGFRIAIMKFKSSQSERWLEFKRSPKQIRP
jgi:hypothetical protein